MFFALKRFNWTDKLNAHFRLKNIPKFSIQCLPYCWLFFLIFFSFKVTYNNLLSDTLAVVVLAVNTAIILILRKTLYYNLMTWQSKPFLFGLASFFVWVIASIFWSDDLIMASRKCLYFLSYDVIGLLAFLALMKLIELEKILIAAKYLMILLFIYSIALYLITGGPSMKVMFFGKISLVCHLYFLLMMDKSTQKKFTLTSSHYFYLLSLLNLVLLEGRAYFIAAILVNITSVFNSRRIDGSAKQSLFKIISLLIVISIFSSPTSLETIMRTDISKKSPMIASADLEFNEVWGTENKKYRVKNDIRYHRIELEDYIKEHSLNSRINQAWFVLQNVQDNFLAGSGIASYRVYYKLNNTTDYYFTYPHNVFLEILYEQGMIGVVLFMISCLLFPLIYIAKMQKDVKPIFIYLLMASFFVIQFQANIISNRYIFYIAGLCFYFANKSARDIPDCNPA